ncbi:hypothetical protein MIR68_010619 [Amoeboaphelidium protococcarum]|nr:hypothetical protein MIR68_010619 [Amoeboaphelidium protococcarum]
MEISPLEELQFKRPFTLPEAQKQILRIKNTSSTNPMVFKVKTTAPKQYCVRPNASIVQPQQTKEIAILLQPMKEDPPEDVRSKDKFLIQSYLVDSKSADYQQMEVSEGGAGTLDIWSMAEKIKVGDLMQEKLRVLYLPADGGVKFDSPSMASSSGGVQSVPASSAVPSTSNTQSPSFSSYVNKAPAVENIVPIKAEASPAVKSPVVESTKVAPSTSTDIAKKQSSESESAEILRLKALVQQQEKQIKELTAASKENELRKRNTNAVSDTKDGKPAQQRMVIQKIEGYPLVMVILAAILGLILGIALF